MLKLDRQKVFLFLLKSISYLVNAAIILAVAAGVAWWGYGLYMSAQMQSYHR